MAPIRPRAAGVAGLAARDRIGEVGFEGAAIHGRVELLPETGRGSRGHGPIQISGRDNHRACGHALGIDLDRETLLLNQPRYGTAAAVWLIYCFVPGPQDS